MGIPRPYEYGPMPGEELPLGFRKIHVLLTDKEYDRFQRESYWLGSGLVMSALRKQAGLPETPHGIKTALQRQRAGQ